MSKKSWIMYYSNTQDKLGQDFLDIQYFLKCSVADPFFWLWSCIKIPSILRFRFCSLSRSELWLLIPVACGFFQHPSWIRIPIAMIWTRNTVKMGWNWKETIKDKMNSETAQFMRYNNFTRANRSKLWAPL